jgi:PBP1b-binding outer membrane lipoprotein LpoB
MKKLLSLAASLFLALLLTGCLASSYSPVGVNCVPGTPFLDMPVACIGF